MAEEKAPSILKAFESDKSLDNTPKDIELAIPIKILGSEEEKARLTGIVNKVAKSSLGRETLEIMADEGYTLDFTSIPDIYGVCDPDKKAISISPNLSDDRLVGTLAHEARHAGQFSRGFLPNVERYNISTLIMLTRSLEADAQSTACKVNYELYLQGDKEAYKLFKKEHPLIAEPFEKVATKEGVNNDKSQTAAFNGWYDNNRLKTVYEDTFLVEEFTKVAKEGHMKDVLFDKYLTGENVVKYICVNAEDEDCYYTDDADNLEKGKFIDICQDTKDFLDKFFKERKEKFGLEPDTLKTIPIRKAIDKKQAKIDAIVKARASKLSR